MIETFIAVADAGSFTIAAERLGMSPALTSKYVGQLEQQLHVRLLNRTTRSVSVTELGKSYLNQARQLVADFHGLEMAIQDRKGEPSGHLVVSAPMTFGEMYLAKAVARFLERYPMVDVDLRLTDRFARLSDEGVDLAVRISELEASSLIARRIAPTRVVAVASPGYIKRAGHPTDPRELVDHDCIIDSNFRSPHEWSFSTSEEEITVSVNGRFSVNSARATREMILSDIGVGIIPTFAIGDQIRQKNAVILFDSYEISDLGIYAVYLPNRYLAPKVRLFIDFLVAQFGVNPEWDNF